MTDIIGYVPMQDGDFHLRDGFCYRREDDIVIVSDTRGVLHSACTDLEGWASVIAHTMPGGDTGENWRSALALLKGEHGD